jgi:hypothetical protein
MKNMRDEIIFMASDQKEKEVKSQALLNQVAALPDTLTRYVRAHVRTQTYAHLHAHAHVFYQLMTRRLLRPLLNEYLNFTAHILRLHA